MNKKILITGSTGKVAEAITTLLLREYPDVKLLLLTSDIKNIKPTKRSSVFQAFYENVKWLKDFVINHKPDIIINCAAMTNVDACEDEKEKAMNLNASLPETLSIAAKKINSHLITFSTDYIFNGKKGPYSELDTPDPINYYGKSKLAGENLAKGNTQKLTIIRTNVVYGKSSYGKNDFIKWVSDKLDNKEKINVITGQWCNPTFTDDIAWAVSRIIETKSYGIINLSGKDWLNRYEIALIVAEVFDYDKNLISPLDPSKLSQKAFRPEKGGLIITSAEGLLGIKLSRLKEGLTTLKFQLNEYEI
ncbi:SDR family oxidoreductase [Candidatus Kapabacteria bacterium]|nr:SDR family oxidoreductase [Candidatus Kapabacteria bacterium]